MILIMNVFFDVPADLLSQLIMEFGIPLLLDLVFRQCLEDGLTQLRKQLQDLIN